MVMKMNGIMDRNKVIDLANRKMNTAGVVSEAGQNARKKYILDHIVPEKNAKKHKSRTCHIHDLECYDITYNCLGISVKDMVGNKSRSFYGMTRALHRAIVELTNIQSGGIGFINFDSDAAAYIGNESDAEITEAFHELFLDLNMSTRKGCENPYVTFNFGLDTSVNGQRIGFLLLDAYEKGDERGNPFIFPNLVFKLKSGVNLEKNTSGYDLYRRAISVTAKRMVPTYFNCDSISNVAYEAKAIGIMGCRTRVVTNVNGKEGSLNRGNVACVTLNLVQMAYQAGRNVDRFYSMLDENLNDAKEVLLHRFRTLCQKGMFEEYYEKGYYLGAEKKDTYEMLKNGTLSIGFIGLWDAVGTLMDCEIDSVDRMKQYFDTAYGIIRYMRDYTDEITKEEHLNISLLATAAEGVTGNFAQHDRENQGEDLRACKKGYYTNSFHVPVNMNINYKDKIRYEGKFHKLCNGGAITYVEFSEMPGRNVEAVQEVVEYAYQKDCNYIGVNFPMDNCVDCGYTGRIIKECPCCGSDKVRRLRRVSGYLSQESSFTAGKKKELSERICHMAAGFTEDNEHEG